ncbi:hypothetical protein Tsubulata_033299 [Turnera subulata]|uniref:Uncharacterized protein n=1 Tax=Turnera subulata TaxID=218843 RepID=A0A9Q0JRI2_9ROSI|nr:hypothetical protein Tsubulata_033299 [Turnera subulata]
MAEERRHGKGSLLLPSSRFFAEEDDIFPVANSKLSHQNWSSCSDFGSSSLSSPVDSSELGSTESDEGEGDGEYIAELTRQMAHYMLQDDDDDLKHPEGQATLVGWSKSHEQLAGMQEIAKLEINEETAEDKSSLRLSSNSLEPNSFHQTEWINPSTTHSAVDLQSKQALIDAQIRAVQLLLQQQGQKQQGSVCLGKQANRCSQKASKRQVRKAAAHEKGIASPGGTGKRQQISVAINLPEQQKINGSDKGEASHGETGSSRLTGSSGTGVFLPRSTSNSTTESSSTGSRTTESRKKPGCSTVIIPARVAQALKLHFDRVGPTSRSNGATLPLQQAIPTGDLRYVLQPKPKTRPKKAPILKCQEDIGLPQEWTYDATT